MKTLVQAVVTLAAVSLCVCATGAQARTKDEKLCSDLASMKDSISQLQQMGPNNTVADLQQAVGKSSDTGQKIMKEASHDSHAKALNDAIQDLSQSAQKLPANMTLATARETLHEQIMAVQKAAKDFEMARCQ